MAKSNKSENNMLTLDGILNDDDMFKRFVEFTIEMSQRQSNLETSKRELKECQNQFKTELGLTKVNLDKVMEYARALYASRPKEDEEKNIISMFAKVSERLVEVSDSNKELQRVLISGK